MHAHTHMHTHCPAKIRPVYLLRKRMTPTMATAKALTRMPIMGPRMSHMLDAENKRKEGEDHHYSARQLLSKASGRDLLTRHLRLLEMEGIAWRTC